jgi:formate hydrogenlyase subunit 4
MSYTILKVFGIIIAAPILGGLISGIDRKITARMQGRIGPPILQPFYDFLKLLGKEVIISNPMQYFYVLSNLVFAIFSLVMFALGRDLLIIVFVMALASISLVLGASTIKSPYSRIGGQRELIQMMSYEPVLVLYAAAVFQLTGSFNVQGVIESSRPLLLSTPLVFIAFLYILNIKLRKSPFDFSSSEHAHQELVRGMLTEFSGPQLAMIELAHWYELVLIVGFIMLFYTTNIFAAIGLVLLSFFLEILIDNVSARINWKWMFKTSWTVGITLCTINILWLYFR